MITPFYRPEGMVVAWGAAIALLWMAEVGSTRDKIRVTLVLPAGALSAVAIQSAGDEGFVYFAIILFASAWPPVYLDLKLRHAHPASDSEDIAGEARQRFGIEPETEERSRSTKWLIGGVLALVVLGATVVAFLSPTGGDTPRITEAQFNQVELARRITAELWRRLNRVLLGTTCRAPQAVAWRLSVRRRGVWQVGSGWTATAGAVGLPGHR